MDIMLIYNWCVANPATLITFYFAFVGLASAIVKVTPTLKDDNILKSIVRFMGKFIALNRK